MNIFMMSVAFIWRIIKYIYFQFMGCGASWRHMYITIIFIVLSTLADPSVITRKLKFWSYLVRVGTFPAKCRKSYYEMG